MAETSLYEFYVARLKRQVLPVAATEIQNLRLMGEEVLAEDPEALRLFRLNLAVKERLIMLGSCYAAAVDNSVAPALVAIAVRWGMLFTMIDTVIDEGGVRQRARCDELAEYLLLPLAPQGTGGERRRPPLQLFLADLGVQIHERLSSQPAYPQLLRAMRPRLERHAQLVTLQHLDPDERHDYLREIGCEHYEQACVDGSPGPIFALIQAALQLGPDFDGGTVATLKDLYFPEFGLLHVWADDLADASDDLGVKDLNLVCRARADGVDPLAAFLSLLRGYLQRLAGLPTRHEVLFPLRLMFEEYLAQARATDKPSDTAAGLDEAVRMLRAVYHQESV